jgi:hypothetical protein
VLIAVAVLLAITARGLSDHRAGLNGAADCADGKLTFNGECDSLRRVLIGERSVSYLVAAILSVTLVRLVIVCAYPRRTLAADGLNANSNDE